MTPIVDCNWGRSSTSIQLTVFGEFHEVLNKLKQINCKREKAARKTNMKYANKQYG